jgi:hypothetical protein
MDPLGARPEGRGEMDRVLQGKGRGGHRSIARTGLSSISVLESTGGLVGEGIEWCSKEEGLLYRELDLVY